MHAKDIAIDEGSVVVKRATTGDVIDIKAHEYGFERDFYIVHLKQPMPFNEDLTIEMKWVLISVTRLGNLLHFGQLF